MISKSLRFLEKQLSQFIRVHKTALINPDCVRELVPPLHTKTSGAVVLEDKTQLPVSRRQWPLLVQELQPDSLPALPPERSIVLVTGDTTKSLLVRQLIATHWPQTLLYVVETSSVVLQMLSLAEMEHPSLLLIDLRQSAQSRLALLRNLKETPHLRRLPVVLLLTPNVNAAGSGYALQANSIVTVAADNNLFVQTMEQVCRYWLTTSSLPAIQGK